MAVVSHSQRFPGAALRLRVVLLLLIAQVALTGAWGKASAADGSDHRVPSWMNVVDHSVLKDTAVKSGTRAKKALCLSGEFRFVITHIATCFSNARFTGQHPIRPGSLDRLLPPTRRHHRWALWSHFMFAHHRFTPVRRHAQMSSCSCRPPLRPSAKEMLTPLAHSHKI